MKKIFLLALIISVGSAAAWFSAKAENPEEHAIKQALENYFRGQATGQGEYYRKVFHPDAKLFAVRDGKYWQLTSEEFAARASGKAAPDEEKRMRRIESIDISGNAAIAKLVLDYPQVKFTDYMSMLKIDGEWKIVNKTFYSEPKPAK